MWTYVFISLEYVPKSGIAKSYRIVWLTNWEHARMLSTVAAPSSIPTGRVGGSYFLMHPPPLLLCGPSYLPIHTAAPQMCKDLPLVSLCLDTIMTVWLMGNGIYAGYQAKEIAGLLCIFLGCAYG
jgi:hypothetical protein